LGISALTPPSAEDLVETTLEFPDNRLLIDLCGEFDRNLAQVEHQMGVHILRRGNRLAVIGDRAGSAQRFPSGVPFHKMIEVWGGYGRLASLTLQIVIAHQHNEKGPQRLLRPLKLSGRRCRHWFTTVRMPGPDTRSLMPSVPVW